MTEIKTTSKAVLRRMLRDCDRKLRVYDIGGYRNRTSPFTWVEALRQQWDELDARRREIRRKLKEHKHA